MRFWVRQVRKASLAALCQPNRAKEKGRTKATLFIIILLPVGLADVIPQTAKGEARVRQQGKAIVLITKKGRTKGAAKSDREEVTCRATSPTR
jgi:hypothetical protein